jgi:Bacterial archaeo-eukaryotic release factor family 10
VSAFRDPALGRPYSPRGGAEDRVRNKADELAKKHFRHVVEQLEMLLRADSYDVLIIGGHDYEVPEFLQFLPLELCDRVAGTFRVDPATAPMAEIRDSVAAIVRRYEREQEQQLVSGLLDKAMGGLAALGLDSCLWAGSVAAIKALLVREGATARGVVCDEFGWLALSGDVCPLCGKPTRRTPDVIDELVTAVIDEGGRVSHIKADTKLNEYLAAADLRFPLPPQPTESP